jgi:hypothetical protein
MFWVGLLVKYGLPIALKWGWVNGGEADAVKAWYWAKTNIKTYSNNDQLNPANSDFPAQKGRDNM